VDGSITTSSSVQRLRRKGAIGPRRIGKERREAEKVRGQRFWKSDPERVLHTGLERGQVVRRGALPCHAELTTRCILARRAERLGVSERTVPVPMLSRVLLCTACRRNQPMFCPGGEIVCVGPKSPVLAPTSSVSTPIHRQEH
jgi:hypothetical protein